MTDFARQKIWNTRKRVIMNGEFVQFIGVKGLTDKWGNDKIRKCCSVCNTYFCG